MSNQVRPIFFCATKGKINNENYLEYPVSSINVIPISTILKGIYSSFTSKDDKTFTFLIFVSKRFKVYMTPLNQMSTKSNFVY